MQSEKTKQQLIAENAALRRKVKESEELQKTVQHLKEIIDLSPLP